VSGYKRVPAPPPNITDKISLDMMRDLLFYLFVVYSLLFCMFCSMINFKSFRQILVFSFCFLQLIFIEQFSE